MFVWGGCSLSCGGASRQKGLSRQNLSDLVVEQNVYISARLSSIGGKS